jgi:uncharacterized membrane protein
MPPWLQVFLAGMSPLGELRLAIPLGYQVLKLPWYQAFLLGCAGNLVIVPILLLFLDKAAALLQRLPGPIWRLLQWRRDRLVRLYSHRFHRYGPAFLVLFVAVPLPLTGAWTGALLAWAFHVPFRQALLAISMGVLIAGVVVTSLTVVGVTLGGLLAA